ncbi:MAG: efflux RND transporter permease subunit [Gammaproteobacteria bacterium]|nr:efflux RND transporter permease subunit [Gammaproteobacteria bacterium]
MTDSPTSADYRSALDRLVAGAMAGPLPLLVMVLAFAVGAVALLITPREEEPQIVVPLADVFVSAPGLSAAQIERQVATPLEKLLYQIDGVEHVYSMSRPDSAVVTVRFFVGEDREDSLIKVYNKIYSHTDLVPPEVASWVVKPVEVDDVPIVIATLWSKNPGRTTDHELRRLAEEVANRLQAIDDTNTITVAGGRPRQIRVELDPQALAARRTAPLEVAWALGISNQRLPAGRIERADEAIIVEAGTFFHDAGELRRALVNVVDGVPVYLADVATISDGPAEPADYTWIAFGPAQAGAAGLPGSYPAVSIAVAKKKGSNAVWVARDVKRYLDELKEGIFPEDVEYEIIRDYGQTANEKINDLVSSLFVAVLTVVIFIGIFLGWRAALVVGLAVPVCYGITLGLDYLAGYTINRVTLFALILALGLLVDDPITGVDNIERHFRLALESRRRAVVSAIGEVRIALIMSTVAIMLAFAPLAFITGMMGPYMAPMAFNVPVAVIMSTVVAFLVTPWLAHTLLKTMPYVADYDVKRTLRYRLYRRVAGPLIAGKRNAAGFLAVMGLLLVVTAALPMFRLVPLKLLPYDNKNEFQLVIDMPEGTTLERSNAVALELAQYLRTVPEVRAIAGFAGTASAMDFNGMVRHYYLRAEPHMAELRVMLAPRLNRSQQSHAMLLRIRKDVEAIGARTGANVKLVEVPPGPPVLSTVVTEIYGSEWTPYAELRSAARIVAERLRAEPLVVDIDTSDEADQTETEFITDKEKAALSGVSTSDVARTLALATGGMTAGHLQIPTEVNPLPIVVRLPYDRRGAGRDLTTIDVKGMAGITKVRDKNGVRDAPQPLVPLGELGAFRDGTRDKTIYHKDMVPVAYVFAEVAGRPPAEIVLDMIADEGARENLHRSLADRSYLVRGGGEPWQIAAGLRAVWDGEGEWDITIRVFRDMGIAFAVALAGIFLVLRIQTGLAAITGIIMLAIPLTVIGIMPGFWLLNQIGTRTVAGYPDPVLFTATAMIGMIALAGIVVRNSLILIEFVHQALRAGMPLDEALIQAGAIRMRPVFLTAGTTLLGNLVITLDPIFSGLAWAIIFGIAASTVFTLVVVPAVYFLVYANKPGHGLPVPATETDS